MLVEFGIVCDKGRYCVDGLKEEEDENYFFGRNENSYRF